MEHQQIIDEKIKEITDSTSGKREQKDLFETFAMSEYNINLDKRVSLDKMRDALLQSLEPTPAVEDVKSELVLSEPEFELPAVSSELIEVPIVENTEIVATPITEAPIIEAPTVNSKINVEDFLKFKIRLLADKSGDYYFADLHERFKEAFLQFKESGLEDPEEFKYQQNYMTLSDYDLSVVHKFVKIIHELKKTHRVKLRGSRNGVVQEV